MSEKRRDNRNRILRNGESQRKDGRYAFKYIDATGKPQFVYSWKLEKTDKLPTGKRDDLSLREKEKLIQNLALPLQGLVLPGLLLFSHMAASWAIQQRFFY